MAKYLVTGGAGFIGSHIAERLLREGSSVKVLDNFSSGRKENLKFAKANKNFQLIKGDIRDYKVCLRATKDIDCVFHQAALRSVPKSMNDPYSYNDVNINGTLNLLKASLKNRIKRFVFASSSSIYGETDIFPEREDSLPLLISPYALSKLAGEYYCKIFSVNYKLETVSLRYFNVYGPRQSLDDEYSVVIPKFINAMMNNRQPPIHGDGKQSRDFTYIDNVVDANILAATRQNIKCDVFNIANNKDHTILELVEILNKIMGKSIKPAFTPLRAGDVLRTFADISKAEKELGYRPKIDFETGLRLTVDWFKSEK
ncbi:MAG: SDR family oxidoreductase [Candidatus Omnitrophica bacterium]|nr:SDR family oxidoreductase [Candidatus Omnitrophota bacterium]MDD5352559.1 SDR family oxidoreductase [Candidatus Omnitrophota bacterium]MDD5550157.1 SDR family oxidoreductase [Candidatus Omnitrophota bacterium]